MRHHRVLTALATMCSLWVLPAAAQSAGLRAGAAKVDITPTADMFPFTGGQAYAGAHDPLYARALVIADGGQTVALIGVDATQLRNGDELLDAVATALKIPRDHVLMSATHDHNAPLPGFRDPASPVELAYARLLKQGVVAAAVQAKAHQQAARIGFGTGTAYVNVNVDGGRDRTTGAGEGPSDKTVAVLSVTTPAGEPIAVYANYPVHANVMNASHTRDGKAEITGDLAGVSAAYVEERLGHGAVAVWTSGAAGDQVPMFGSNGKFWSGASPETWDEGAAGWGVLDVQARKLADAIVQVTRSIRSTTDHAALWGADTSVTCPGQRNDPSAPGGAKLVDAPPVTIPLKLVMVGDVALAGVSGEVYTQIGEHLKAVSPFDRTMMVTNLPKAVGYILTDEAYVAQTSGKKVPNSLKPGCAEPAMIAALTGLMNRYIDGAGTPR